MSFSMRAAAIAGTAALIISMPLYAQDGGDIEIDPAVFNMYLESLTQQPASQATAEQIEQVRSQLTDIYLLSN
ncbi:MAG: hypothetical protein P8Y01_16360, partial [Woeseiaceae bacterium]